MVDPAALDEVRNCWARPARARDLLIEHLHKLQDRFRPPERAPPGGAGAGDGAGADRGLRGGDLLSPLRRGQGRRRGAAGADGAGLRRAVLRDGRRSASCWTSCRRCWAATCASSPRHASAAANRRRPSPWASIRSAQATRRWRCRPPCSRGSTTHQPEGFIDLDAYKDEGGYALLKTCIAGEIEVDAVITALEHSGLRGLGGAGFPTGRKWRIVRNEPAPRLMAVNIDEGEPGTFKDRVYLERDPHRFLEGMLIAAWAVGIARVYVYLRDEYHGCRAMLRSRAGPAARASALARHARDRTAPRRRRLHLRRRVGHDRVDRGQARHAAAASALRRAGGPVRPADAGAQLRDAVLGARDPRKGRRLVRRRTAATAARDCAASRCRAGSRSRA